MHLYEYDPFALHSVRPDAVHATDPLQKLGLVFGDAEHVQLADFVE